MGVIIIYYTGPPQRKAHVSRPALKISSPNKKPPPVGQDRPEPASEKSSATSSGTNLLPDLPAEPIPLKVPEVPPAGNRRRAPKDSPPAGALTPVAPPDLFPLEMRKLTAKRTCTDDPPAKRPRSARPPPAAPGLPDSRRGPEKLVHLGPTRQTHAPLRRARASDRKTTATSSCDEPVIVIGDDVDPIVDRHAAEKT